jgi:hypothetical protein
LELDTYLHAFPMGASKAEVFKNAQELDDKHELNHSQQWGTDYKTTTFSGYPADLLFVIYDYNGNGNLRQMKITMKSKYAPVGEIYQQFYKVLTERYGMPLQEGQPPYRILGTKAWSNGEGALWKVTPDGGKAFMLMISIEPEKQKDDGLREFYIESRTEINK